MRPDLGHPALLIVLQALLQGLRQTEPVGPNPADSSS